MHIKLGKHIYHHYCSRLRTKNKNLKRESRRAFSSAPNIKPLCIDMENMLPYGLTYHQGLKHIVFKSTPQLITFNDVNKSYRQTKSKALRRPNTDFRTSEKQLFPAFHGAFKYFNRVYKDTEQHVCNFLTQIRP